MNKRIALIFILLLISNSVISAEKYYGIRTGLHLSELKKNNADLSPYTLDTAKLKTINVGLFYGHNLSSISYLQGEINYSSFGEEIIDQGRSIRNYFNYIRFNLLYKIKLSTDKIFDLSFFGGPSLGVKISAKQKTTLQGNDLEFEAINVKDYDPAIILGAGLSFMLGNLQLDIEGRFLKSVSTILEDVPPGLERDVFIFADRTTGRAYDWRNQVVSIQVGLAKNF